jgi:hypothetical protein
MAFGQADLEQSAYYKRAKTGFKAFIRLILKKQP